MSKKYSAVPLTTFPTLFSGFALARAAELLETYGGFVNDPPSQESIAPDKVHSAFLAHSGQTDNAFERYHRQPYADVETYLEVVYYVVATTDLLLQSLYGLDTYLPLRSDMQRVLLSLIQDLFGFDAAHTVTMDANLVDRAALYVPDSLSGVLALAEVLDARLKSDPAIFAQAAYGYTLLAFDEVFGSMLLYETGSDGSCVANCPHCRSAMSAEGSDVPDSFRCSSCGNTYFIDSLYE